MGMGIARGKVVALALAAVLLLSALGAGPAAAATLGRGAAKGEVAAELGSHYKSFGTSSYHKVQCPQRVSDSTFRCIAVWLKAPLIYAAVAKVRKAGTNPDGTVAYVFSLRGYRFNAKCIRQHGKHIFRCKRGKFSI